MFGLGKKRSFEDFVLGKYGETVQDVLIDLVNCFGSMGLFKKRGIYYPELGTLASFISFVALRNNLRKAKITEEIAADVAANFAIYFCRVYKEKMNLDKNEFEELKLEQRDRTVEYIKIWDESEKSNDRGLFYYHVHCCMQNGSEYNGSDFINFCISFHEVLDHSLKKFELAIN